MYKGLKPVFWCIHDQTALAEAEVEYEQHTSPSVYVRYRLTSPPESDRAGAGWARGVHDHLDDDAVDDSGEPGGGVQPGDGVRGGLRPVRMSGGLHVVAGALRKSVEKRCGLV